MIAVILLLWRFGHKLRESRWEDTVRCTLAFLLLCSEMAYYWRLVAQPWLEPNAVNNLPIGVCGWAAIFCTFMLVGKKQGFFDISYFWLLSGSVFALLTPTPLNFTGPTRFRYYQFWGEHTLGYVAIFYMIFVHGMRPTVKSAVNSYVALAAMSALAYWVNTMIPGANYLYLARPEAAPSVLDILPPHYGLRVTIMIAVITLMFGLAYLPWYRMDQKVKKSHSTV
jgi:hypothetical integral membrane protein (TIGR02206 family)